MYAYRPLPFWSFVSLTNASNLDGLMKSVVCHVFNFILFLPFTLGEKVLCLQCFFFINVILYACNVCCCFFFFSNRSAFHHRFLIKTEYFLAVNVFLKNKQTKKSWVLYSFRNLFILWEDLSVLESSLKIQLKLLVLFSCCEVHQSTLMDSGK